MVFGKPPPSLPNYITGSTSIEALDSDLTGREAIISLLKKKLLKAQEMMKVYVDKHRIPHKFQAGDLVFIKLRLYRQHSLAGHRI